MSRQKKSGKKNTTKTLTGKFNHFFGFRKITPQFADITLNDFANSTSGKSRSKKSTSNVVKVLKQLESEKTWEENTDLFEGDFDFVPEENDDGTVSYIVRKVRNVYLKIY